MPIPPDQLPERHPERVGEFLNLYGARVVVCDHPIDDVDPTQRRMSSSCSNTARTVEEIGAWARQQMIDHIVIHRETGTTPCNSYTEPISAIYRSPEGAGVEWVPVRRINVINA